MRKTVILSLMSLMLLLLLVIATAAGEKTSASTKQYHRMHGEIASIDATAKTFTVKHGNDTSTFGTDNSTKYRGAGKEISIADLKVGDDVRVSFTEQEGQKIAARVDIAHAHTHNHTTDPGPACPVGYHRCKQDCCKD
ncbi:MAG: copper-binding protein [Acidobacteria bacterium]|jgi:Cu/Ag efflux protein CusF|nr:copper-binding protein [Acidobacteriota bacterium]